MKHACGRDAKPARAITTPQSEFMTDFKCVVWASKPYRTQCSMFIGWRFECNPTQTPAPIRNRQSRERKYREIFQCFRYWIFDQHKNVHTKQTTSYTRTAVLGQSGIAHISKWNQKTFVGIAVLLHAKHLNCMPTGWRWDDGECEPALWQNVFRSGKSVARSADDESDDKSVCRRNRQYFILLNFRFMIHLWHLIYSEFDCAFMAFSRSKSGASCRILRFQFQCSPSIAL